jgi:hypothetical protein
LISVHRFGVTSGRDRCPVDGCNYVRRADAASVAGADVDVVVLACLHLEAERVVILGAAALA